MRTPGAGHPALRRRGAGGMGECWPGHSARWCTDQVQEGGAAVHVPALAYAERVRWVARTRGRGGCGLRHVSPQWRRAVGSWGGDLGAAASCDCCGSNATHALITAHESCCCRHCCSAAMRSERDPKWSGVAPITPSQSMTCGTKSAWDQHVTGCTSPS